MQRKSREFEDKLLEIYEPAELSTYGEIPVLYVLDGNAFGVLTAQAVTLQSRNSLKTGVWPALIVAIGYPETTYFHKAARFQDYTPKQQTQEKNKKWKDMPTGGGIEAFQAQLVRIHEWICSKYAVKSEKVGLFGHSLGGLCVLECLLATKQLPFLTDYLAVSPSLWWDNGAYYRKCQTATLPSNKRVMIAVENDQEIMEKNARTVATLFAHHFSSEQFSFYLGTEENHMSIVFASISRLLRWFFKEEQD